MAILGSKIQRGGGVKYFGRVSIWTFSYKWFCTFIALFYPQQGAQILEKASKVRLFAAISHPIVVISTF